MAAPARQLPAGVHAPRARRGRAHPRAADRSAAPADGVATAGLIVRSLRRMALSRTSSRALPSHRLLLLVHGYGADERDLGGLLTYLDPDGEFAAVLPRAPIAAPGTPGFMWYDVRRRRRPAGSSTRSPSSTTLVDEQCARARARTRARRSSAGSRRAPVSRSGSDCSAATAARPPAGVLAMSPVRADAATVDAAQPTCRCSCSTAPTIR